MPAKGWVRGIREALGMSVRQLAERAGLERSTVSRLEKNEMDRTIGLESLDRLAQALGCRLDYVLIPERSLEEMVLDRSRQRATEELARLDHTMALELQAADAASKQRLLDARMRELRDDRRLWDEP